MFLERLQNQVRGVAVVRVLVTGLEGKREGMGDHPLLSFPRRFMPSGSTPSGEAADNRAASWAGRSKRLGRNGRTLAPLTRAAIFYQWRRPQGTAGFLAGACS
ncbi:MAG: hypothetical protein L0215_20370 [Gemmataceae bacterium]|nr:hypothetical protein [Gemmataceae bacterium]